MEETNKKISGGDARTQLERSEEVLVKPGEGSQTNKSASEKAEHQLEESTVKAVKSSTVQTSEFEGVSEFLKAMKFAKLPTNELERKEQEAELRELVVGSKIGDTRTGNRLKIFLSQHHAQLSTQSRDQKIAAIFNFRLLFIQKELENNPTFDAFDLPSYCACDEEMGVQQKFRDEHCLPEGEKSP